MIGDTLEPAAGQPSLTSGEIAQLYRQYLRRDPDSQELSSELDNANKYSAAGIERQIRNRAGNVAASGIRGDEGLAPLTIPRPTPPPIGNILTLGPAAGGYMIPGGPTGLANPNAPYNYQTMAPTGMGGSGMSMTIVLLLVAVAGAAFFLLRK